MTQAQLDKLKNAYARGVLKIREGDTWLEYQTMKEMRIAIRDIETEIAGTKPKGTRLVTTSKGY